jgi:hypothetical protein
MAINIELRRKVAGSFDNQDSVLHPITKPQNIIGFLDTNNKINESFLPGSVFGGMRFVGQIDDEITTGTTAHESNTLAAQINTFLSNNGGTPNGLYWIATTTVTVTASNTNTFSTALGGAGEEGDSGAINITLESGDWLVCKGLSSGTYVFAVVNNNYRLSSSTASGLMSSTQFSKLAGIAENANAYVHDTFAAISDIALNGVDVLSTFKRNNEGHVTEITTRTMQDATTAQKGVTQLATGTELTTALSSTKPAASADVKSMIDYFTGNTLYTTLANANSASHPDGSIVFVTVPAS